jgi:hypothetical protein
MVDEIYHLVLYSKLFAFHLSYPNIVGYGTPVFGIDSVVKIIVLCAQGSDSSRRVHVFSH